MKNRILTALLLTFFIVGSGIFRAEACTNYLITKGASVDGSTMISYAADSHVLYGELYHWAAATWPEGTLMDVYEWDTGKYLGKIKQAAQTYNVVGNINEFQVSIGETTYGGLPELGSLHSASPCSIAAVMHANIFSIRAEMAAFSFRYSAINLSGGRISTVSCGKPQRSRL